VSADTFIVIAERHGTTMLATWAAWCDAHPHDDFAVDGWHGTRRLRRDGTISEPNQGAAR
jgi:hypothetical protein